MNPPAARAPLSPPDLALARAAIASGRAIEALWGPGADPDVRLPEPADEPLEAFRAAVANARGAADPDLSRLARLAAGLGADISLRALIAVLAPFERWAERPLRDDEFQVSALDRPGAPSPPPAASRPLIGVLDNLRSAFNVGSIFRAAECAGLERLLLTGYTPAPSSSDATGRTAMGADALLPWRAYGRLSEAARALRADGFSLVALETSESAVGLYEMRWPEKCALLIGNERFGLGVEALREADVICKIPMRGRKNSLNVGAAFAVAAFEQRRSSGAGPAAP